MLHLCSLLFWNSTLFRCVPWTHHRNEKERGKHLGLGCHFLFTKEVCSGSKMHDYWGLSCAHCLSAVCYIGCDTTTGKNLSPAVVLGCYFAGWNWLKRWRRCWTKKLSSVPSNSFSCRFPCLTVAFHGSWKYSPITSPAVIKLEKLQRKLEMEKVCLLNKN